MKSSFLISDLLTKQLVEKVNSSEYYAILIDESTDISVSKRLSICVRYVTDGSAETSFLGNCELVAGDAHTITKTLHKFLEGCGIDMSKCTSLATDGASVMMGRKSGVGVQLVSKYSPFLTQTHCVAHRLNLAVTDSIKDIDTLKKFKDKFSSIYNYMSASANRCYELKNMQKLLDEPELTIKEPFLIRWLGLKRAVEAVYESYGAVLATLSSKASENATAKGLYKYFANYKTALLLGLMIDVHSEPGVLSCQLQSRDIMFTDVAPLIESTVGKLEIMKIQNGSGLADMKASIKVEDGKAFYHSDELKYHSKEADSQFENVKINYLNNLCKNIRRRIRKHDCDLFIYMSQVLEPSTSQHLSFDETTEAAEKLAEHFGKEKTVTVCEGDLITGVVNRETVIEPLLDGEKLIQECHGLHGMRKGTYRGLSLYALSQRIILKHMTQFPNLAKLATIALCTQVTSVECERSFRTQNRIKSKFRYFFLLVGCLGLNGPLRQYFSLYRAVFQREGVRKEK